MSTAIQQVWIHSLNLINLLYMLTKHNSLCNQEMSEKQLANDVSFLNKRIAVSSFTVNTLIKTLP
jgi:hypothetical protein